MAQIFSPSADSWLRLILGVAAAAAVIVLIGGADLIHSTYVTQVGWVVHQTVPFSHKHHVGELGIDCRNCHTGVETSARAGLPSTHICMACHSQLWTGAPALAPVRESMATGRPLVWHRVAQVPDYVYFNHSIHVTRGVACVECHGRIDQMPLTRRAKPFEMQFCLACHRDPAPHLGRPELVTRMTPLHQSSAEKRKYGLRMMATHHIRPETLDNCEICHR